MMIKREMVMLAKMSTKGFGVGGCCGQWRRCKTLGDRDERLRYLIKMGLKVCSHIGFY